MNDVLSQQLERIVFAQCEDTDTPRALTVHILVREKEYGQLFALKTDPQHYLTSDSFKLDNQVTEFLRKLQLDVPGIDRKKVALDAFYASERQCKRSNDHFHRFQHGGPFEDPRELRLDGFLSSCRKIIDDVLGPIPQGLEIKHGPGATFADRGKLSTVPDKMSSRPTITSSARCLIPFWEETAWARALMQERPTFSDPETVRGNRFTTVPKDALKDRGICIEPSLNVSFQLSVGRLIKERLKRYGMDLTYAQDVHRSLAMAASRTGEAATIDLSNASDTVSVALVRLLLPPRWFDLLDSLRSTHTLIGGKWVKLEKFSSMGNGYTFELETLIFMALAYACALELGSSAFPGKGIHVYGDDIIVPTDIAPTVIACLRFAGFTPNPRKTFLTGLFRESCGGDFFDGKPVRAHYLKEDPHEPQHFIALANGIRRLAYGRFQDPSHWRFYRRCWLKCLDALPSAIRRLRGPVSTGDLTIHDSKWTCKETPNGWGLVRGYLPVQKRFSWDHWRPGVVLASALYGLSAEGVSPRDNVSGYRIKWVSVFDRPGDHAVPDGSVLTSLGEGA
jgi:hypothetical protein